MFPGRKTFPPVCSAWLSSNGWTNSVGSGTSNSTVVLCAPLLASFDPGPPDFLPLVFVGESPEIDAVVKK